MARILFYLPLPRPHRKHYVPFHRGIGQITAILRREGHAVQLHMPHRIAEEAVRADCERYGPDALFVSLASPQTGDLRPIARAASVAGKPLLVGGPHPTFAPEEVLAIPGVSAICRGEGEAVAQAFLRGERNVPGLVFPGREHSLGKLADLTALPLPDRAVFAGTPEFRLNRSIVGHEFAAARGCPFQCRYCSNHGFHALYGTAHLRRLPVAAVLREAEAALTTDPHVSVVGFHDDIFTLDPAWLGEFADHWPRRIGLPFWVNAHPALLSPERVQLLRRAGCVRVHVGVESGSEALRSTILGRTVTDRTILQAADQLKRAGIRVVTFMMLGIPGETEATYREGVSVLRRIRPAWIIQSYYVPLPGTPLGEECRSRLPVTSWEELTEDSYYLTPRRSWAPALSPERVREMGESLIRDVYG